MTTDNMSHSHKQPRGKMRPDDIQKLLWKYRVHVIVVVALFVLGRFLLPHTFLKGWEQKFSQTAVERGLEDLPEDLPQLNELNDAVKMFQPLYEVQKIISPMSGPLLTHAWKCTAAGDKSAACFRYTWQGEPLTLVVLKHSSLRAHGKPFTKGGLGGYLVMKDGYAAALVGPFSPDDIAEAWPYSMGLRIKMGDQKN